MPFDPFLAAHRFGLGPGPGLPPPESAEAMLARLAGPDEAAARLPLAGFAAVEPPLAAINAAARARRRGTEAERAEAAALHDALRAEARRTRDAQFAATLARAATAGDDLRERLVLFWADHFTVRGKNAAQRHLVSPFVEDAIRPRVAGTFPAMLEAATLHPSMLVYLDQVRSAGPGSAAGANGRGLNENLARELLELHTLGVGGPYGQADVRELAELLTGVGTDGDGALAFRPRWAEPGADVVLGASYGPEPGLGPVREALRDIALNPATAQHLARKLAVHFVADDPPQALVDALAAAYGDTGGDLAAVTAALLGHPDAWAPARRKVKPPFDFVASSLRALGVGEEVLGGLEGRPLSRLFLNPLGVMGQPWQQPPGPDGWPEEPEAWITPQFMAARIDWAMNRPEEMRPELPDPRALVEASLGPLASAGTLYAARAAERPSEGVGVVLASADFNRR